MKIRTFFTPIRIIIVVYLVIILLGTSVLLLPYSHRGKLSFVDSLFTATSALCVTGLIVKDTPVDFTPLGKAIILLLIQIGGLGYMAFATLFFLIFRKNISIKGSLMAKESLNLYSLSGISEFVLSIIKFTFVFELIGFIILFLRFKLIGFPLNSALSHSIFQSISAFCNAGFSTFSDNLAQFKNDPIIILTVSALIILGGIGFIVMWDIKKRIRKEIPFLSFHTKITLTTTLFLIITGTILFFVGEYNNTLSNVNLLEKIEFSFFNVVTPRTAGFSILNIGRFTPFTIMLIIALMFVGASPGGTGGGIKTTTFSVIISYVFSQLKGKANIHIFKRRISNNNIDRAFVIFIIGLIIIGTGITFLSFTERALIAKIGFLPVIFEEFSAFGTVGLSMGKSITSSTSLSTYFSNYGKLIIILTMLSGRAGPLSIMAVFVKKGHAESFQYPDAKLLVG